jgi:hypothetical protein
LGECQKKLPGFLSCCCGLFIIKSSLRPLSGRVAQHAERLPWSTHCTAPIPHSRHRTNRRSPRALRNDLGAPPSTTARGRRRKGERRICYRSSSGRNQMVRPGSIVWRLSEANVATAASPHHIGTSAIRLNEKSTVIRH